MVANRRLDTTFAEELAICLLRIDVDDHFNLDGGAEG